MRVTVEDGESRLVLESPETVGKSWAAYNAAHPHHGGHPKKPTVAKPTASEFQRAQQTIADERAGKPVSAADLKNAHAVHEAHLAHLAHEKALAEQAAEAKAPAPQPAPAAANRGAGAAKIAQITATQKAAAEPEMRFIVGLAYQCGIDPAIAKGQDGGRDFFTKEELLLAAHSFMKNGPVGGLFHADGTEGHVTFVESGIHRGPTWDAGNGVVLKDGDWFLGAICDPVAWDLVKSGRVTGFSPQGRAVRRKPLTA